MKFWAILLISSPINSDCPMSRFHKNRLKLVDFDCSTVIDLSMEINHFQTKIEMASYSAVIGCEMIQIPPSQGSSLDFDFAHLRIQESLTQFRFQWTCCKSFYFQVVIMKRVVQVLLETQAAALRSISHDETEEQGKLLTFRHATQGSVVRKQNYWQIKTESWGTESVAQAVCTRR